MPPLVWRQHREVNKSFFDLEKGGSGSDRAHWASAPERVKRMVRQSAVSHPAPHHSPHNSSCHLVSSATPHRPGKNNNKNDHPLLNILLKSFVRSWKFVPSRILMDVSLSPAATVGFLVAVAVVVGCQKRK